MTEDEGTLPDKDPQTEEETATQNEVAVFFSDLQENSPVKLVGKVWEVVVIREGLSLNGTYYTKECLQESIPLWEGEEVAFYGWDPNRRDHVPNHVEQAFPEGTFANNGGFIKNVRGRIREGRYELVADFVCTRDDLRSQLLEMHKHGGRMPGFSIHARGETEQGIREGKRVNLVTRITETKELTLVSKPAAGGKATRLVAGQNTTEIQEEENKMDLSKVRAYVAGKMPAAMAGTVKEMEAKPLLESAASYLKEMDGCKALVELAMEFLAAGNNEQAMAALEKAMNAKAPEAPMEEMDDEIAEDSRALKNEKQGIEEAVSQAEKRLEQKLALQECKATLNARLAEAKLDKKAEDKIRKQFAGKVFKESELDAELEFANHLIGMNAGGEARIENAGPKAEVLVESSDKFQAAMDLIVGVDPNGPNVDAKKKELYKSIQGAPETRSFRRLYESVTGDYDLRKVGRNNTLQEAVNNTTFSDSLGSSVELVLQQDFSREEAAPWEGFIKQYESDNLLTKERVMLGGIGVLPTVAEGGTYTDIAQPVDYKDTYSLTKKGGYYSVTMEAILNDRIGVIQALPQKIRDAALEARDQVAYKALTGDLGGGGINTDTSYDSIVHYSASHFNYSTTALSNAALVTARQQTRKTRVVAAESALNDGTDINSSDTTVTVDDSTGFRAGMYLRMESEWMYISSVSGNDLTVVRGQLGSTAASHVDDTPCYATSGTLRMFAPNGVYMYVIVPYELEDEALVALGSQFLPGGGNNDVNTLYSDYQNGRIQIVATDASYLGGDTTNWYTAVPHQIAAGLEVGYLSGHRTPVLINETQDQVGQVFLADTMRFKARYFVGATNSFHEGRTGHIVAG